MTAVETFHVEPRWLFVKVSTDRGIDGYGEPIVEGRARIVAQAVDDMAEYLIGKDPRRVEHHWQALYRDGFYRGGPILTSALSGVEQALWDIKGKELGVPVYELLGGRVRDSVLVYAHCEGDEVEDLVESARRRLKEGYRNLKFALSGPAWPVETSSYVDSQIGRVAAVRDAIGPDHGLAVDFHGRVTPAVANVLLPELEQYRLLFAEEPCLPENVAALADISRRTTTPIAAGERLFTRWQFREVFERRAVAVIQPDLCHAGGIFESRKIAAMAETYYVSVAPHNPLGPISLAACLQLDSCIPNFLVQEVPGLADGSDRGEGLAGNPFVVENGSIPVPTGPGLGIEIDEDLVRRRLSDGRWRSPTSRHADGSVADW